MLSQRAALRILPRRSRLRCTSTHRAGSVDGKRVFLRCRVSRGSSVAVESLIRRRPCPVKALTASP